MLVHEQLLWKSKCMLANLLISTTCPLWWNIHVTTHKMTVGSSKKLRCISSTMICTFTMIDTDRKQSQQLLFLSLSSDYRDQFVSTSLPLSTSFHVSCQHRHRLDVNKLTGSQANHAASHSKQHPSRQIYHFFRTTTNSNIESLGQHWSINNDFISCSYNLCRLIQRSQH